MNAGEIGIDLTLDVDKFAVNVRSAERLISQLEGRLQSTVRAADRTEKSFNGLTTSFRNIVMTAASVRFALMDIDDLFLALPKSILKTTGEFERAIQLMKGLSNAATEAGRIKEAGDNFKYVLELSKSAPFEISALTDSFVKFKSAGLDPTNGSLRALVDGVAQFGGTGDTLKRASVAIQQMSGKGVISMEELRQQLGEAVPTAMSMMALGMKMSMAELADAVGKGRVPAEDALKRMNTVMAIEAQGAAAEMMKTWTGLTSRLKTEWEILKNDAGKSGFADAMKTQVGDLVELLDSLEGRRFAADFGDSLAGIVKGMRELIDTGREYSDVLKVIGTFAMVAYPVSKLVSFVAATQKGASEVIAANNRQLLSEREKLAAMAHMDAEAAARKASQHATEIVAADQKYRKLVARHEAYLLQIQALEAANDALANRARSGASLQANPNYQRNNEDIRQKELSARKNYELIESHRRLHEGMLDTQRSLDETARKTGATADGFDKMGNRINAVQRIASAGKWVFGAMGGWVGVITTALSLGATAWALWGNKGDEAIRKVKDAVNRGLADKATVQALTDRQGELSSEEARLNKEKARVEGALAKGPRGAALTARQDELAVINAQLKKVTDEFAQNLKDLPIAKRDALNNESADAVGKFGRDRTAAFEPAKDKYLETKAGLQKAYNEQIAQINASTKSEKEKAKLRNDLEKKLGDDQRKALQIMTGAQAQAADALLQRAESELAAAKASGADDYVIAQRKAVRDAALAASVEAADSSRNAKALDQDPTLLLGKEKKPKKAPKGPVDPLIKMLERSQGDLAKSKTLMDSLEDGYSDYFDLYDSILAKLVEEHEGADEKMDMRLPLIAANQAQTQVNKRIQDAMKDLAATDRQLSEARARALAAVDDKYVYDAQATGVARLKNQFDELLVTLPKTGENFDALKAKMALGLAKQASTDLAEFTRSLKQTNDELAISLIRDPSQQAAARNKKEIEEVQRLAQVRIDSVNAAVRAGTQTEAAGRAEIRRAEEEVAQFRKQKAEELVRTQETALQRLAWDWQNQAATVNQVVADWAKQSMDWITELAATGKFQWRDMISSMLKDMLRLTVQQTFGGAVSGLMKGAGGLMNTLLGSITQPVLPAATTPALGAGVGAAATPFLSAGLTAGVGAISGGQGGGDVDLTSAAKGADKLGVATEDASKAITDVTKASEQNVFQILAGVAAKALGISMETTASTTEVANTTALAAALVGATVKVAAFAAALELAAAKALGSAGAGAGAGGGGKFANGGIMSSAGPIPLKAYARGGIARSPQLALFGEGDMNEAYVPLPDGRSIPVTMKGPTATATEGNTQVNISISVTGKGESSESSGPDAKMWSALAGKVKGIVIDTLMTEKQPGGALY